MVQVVGKTTKQMMAIPEGERILDFVGPLGLPSEVERFGTVVLVGGGLGVAPVFPQLRAFKQVGNRTISIIGFRNRDLIFWEDKFREFSDELHVATDDGSYGMKGFVTVVLKELLAQMPPKPAQCIAIGPLIMMKACCDVTRPFGVQTIVSLNSIMVDGTGMCGTCRVTVGGQMRFACVDGPDFDGHEVDFDELMHRQVRYRTAGDRSRSSSTICGVAQGEDPVHEVRETTGARIRAPGAAAAGGGEAARMLTADAAARARCRSRRSPRPQER